MEHNNTVGGRANSGRRSNQEINEIIHEYESSGFSIQDYCDYKGLNPATLQSWLSRHRNNNTGQPVFAPITLKEDPVEECLFAEYKGMKFFQPLSAEFIKSLIG